MKKSKLSERLPRVIAWLLLSWGLFGGWALLGTKWPHYNRLSKDQATIAFGVMLVFITRTT